MRKTPDQKDKKASPNVTNISPRNSKPTVEKELWCSCCLIGVCFLMFFLYLCYPCVWLASYLLFDKPREEGRRESAERRRKQIERERWRKEAEVETRRKLQKKANDGPERPKFGPQMKAPSRPKQVATGPNAASFGPQVKVNYELRPMSEGPKMKNPSKPQPKPRDA